MDLVKSNSQVVPIQGGFLTLLITSSFSSIYMYCACVGMRVQVRVSACMCVRVYMCAPPPLPKVSSSLLCAPTPNYPPALPCSPLPISLTPSVLILSLHLLAIQVENEIPPPPPPPPAYELCVSLSCLLSPSAPPNLVSPISRHSSIRTPCPAPLVAASPACPQFLAT